MTFLHWLSLLRVPVVFGLIYGPGMILMMRPGMSLSRGFADLTPWQFLFVAAVLWSAAVSLAATSNLILLYGHQRINCFTTAHAAGAPAEPALSSKWVILLSLLPSLATVCYVVWTAPQLDPGNRSMGLYALMAIVALVVILGMTIALVWLALYFTAPHDDVAAPAELILPMTWIPQAERTYRAQPPAARLRARASGAARWLAKILGPGYFDPRHNSLLPGHALSGLLVIGYLLLYAVGGDSVTFHGSVMKDSATPVIGHFASALAFIVILLTLVCWLLGALGFFFDRWRIPLLTPFVLVAVVSAFLTSRDHVFPVVSDKHAPKRPDPTAVLLTSRSGPRVLIVASAGGGIQAAAWTTTVMAGLQRRDARFRDTVRLVSGVSGGSVGLFYSLRLYPKMEGSGISLEDLAQLGSTSVLEAVAHGLAYPWSDRGQALEDCLGAAAHNHVTFGHYAKLMLAEPGSLPGVILNTTSVEDGSPVAFSSTTLFSGNTGIRDWLEAEGNAGEDIRLPTAARLSATFPYVTPSARTWHGRPTFRHFGDGGYFDNYGLYSSLAWLEDGLDSLPYDPKQKLQVLLLAIESFPTDTETPPETHGRLWQFLAPINLLYNARSYSQRYRDDLELSLYNNRFQAIYGMRPDQLARVTLRYRATTDACKAPPLSWHLNAVEKKCIADSWDAVQKDPQTGQPDPALLKVLNFVAGT